MIFLFVRRSLPAGGEHDGPEDLVHPRLWGAWRGEGPRRDQPLPRPAQVSQDREEAAKEPSAGDQGQGQEVRGVSEAQERHERPGLGHGPGFQG